MPSITKKYQELVEILEKNIKDARELELAKRKLIELSLYYAESLDFLIDMQNNMDKVSRNVNKLNKRIESIEDDIYVNAEDEDELEPFGSDQMHDNDFEFEITCPYCNYEFVTDNSYKNENEITCPKCKKTIELDWNEEESCSGDCRGCGSHCFYDNSEDEGEVVAVSEDDEDYNENETKKEENKNQEDKKDENEDDM